MSFLSRSLSILKALVFVTYMQVQAAVYMKTNVLLESNLQNEAVQGMIDKDFQEPERIKKNQESSIKTARKLVRWISLHPKTNIFYKVLKWRTEETACLLICASLVLLHIHLVISYHLPSSDSKRIPQRLLIQTGHSCPISLIGSTVPWQYWQQEPGQKTSVQWNSACCDPKMPNNIDLNVKI